MLSDKSRLVAASARLQTNDPNAHEKFQALVETCAGKSQKISVNSANGSPSKEDLDDDSKLERHSSYSSTSGSAEIEQDSRSSHDMKDTGIDVERPHHIHELAGDLSRKPFNSSPDLNLNLDSNDSYNPGSPIAKCDTTLTAHMAGLHVAKPGAPPKILGVEASDPAARVSCIPPIPHHFYGPSSDVQSPNSSEYISNSSVLRPSPLQADAHADPTRLSESSFPAETPASAPCNRGLESYSRLFHSQSSFSTTSTANTSTDSLRDSATPVATIARKDPDDQEQ